MLSKHLIPTLAVYGCHMCFLFLFLILLYFKSTGVG